MAVVATLFAPPPSFAQTITRSVTLAWTAPGDNGTVGTAAAYSIRYTTTPLSEANWASATAIAGVPAPLPAGTAQAFAASGFSPGVTYYFGIKAVDLAGNWSALSNVMVVAMPAVTPFVSSFAPASGVAGTTLAFTLTGTDFQSPDSVWLQQGSAPRIVGTSVSTPSATQVTGSVALPSTSIGWWDVVVKNPDGKSDTMTSALYVAPVGTAPAPSIASVSPATAPNTGSVSISALDGANFVAPSAVQLRRAGQPSISGTGVVNVSASRLTCSFNLSGAQTGAWDLYVANPDGQSATAVGAFSVTAGNPAPTVSAVSPVSGASGQTLTGVLINGSNFTAPDSVFLTQGALSFAATSVVVQSAAQISCTLNLAGLAGGSYTLRVKNPDGQSGTLTGGFTVTVPSPPPTPAPSISSITPSSGLNTGTVSITALDGSNFVAPTAVQLRRSGQASIAGGNVVNVSSSRLTCTFNLSGSQAGVWDVVVANPDGQSATKTGAFTVVAPPPPFDVVSVTPSAGMEGGSIHISNLAGTGFGAPAALWLSRPGSASINAANVQVPSATQITADFLLGASADTGLWNVVLRNGDGRTDSLLSAFHVTAPPPAVASLTPALGYRGTSVRLFVQGSAFLAPNTVVLRYGSTVLPTSLVSTVNVSEVDATVNLASGTPLGTYDLVVTNADGQAATLASAFQVKKARPSVRTISSTHAYTGLRDFALSMSGTALDSSEAVYLDDGGTHLAATSVSGQGDTLLTARFNLRGAASGTCSVWVDNGDGAVSAPQTLSLAVPTAPSGLSSTPASGWAGENDSLCVLAALTAGSQPADSIWIQHGLERRYAHLTVVDSISGSWRAQGIFDLAGAAPGAWDVGWVDMAGNSAALSGGFQVGRRAVQTGVVMARRAMRRGSRLDESLEIRNVSAAPLTVRLVSDVPWLSSSADSVTVGPNATFTLAQHYSAVGLVRASYGGTLSILPVAGDASALTLPETLQVLEPRVDMSTDPLRGEYTLGQQSGSQPLVLAVRNTGDATLHFTFHSDRDWCAVTLLSGVVAPGASVLDTLLWNGAHVTPGTYGAALWLASDDSSRSLIRIADTLVVHAPAQDASPLLCPPRVAASWARGSARVTWSASADARVTGYAVLRRAAGSASDSYQRLATLEADTLAYIDASADTTRSYVYRVDPVDASGGANAGCYEAALEPAATLATAPAQVFSYPNPFGSHLHVRVDVPVSAGAGARVRVSIFDASRRLVRQLLSDAHDPGRFVLEWDGRNGEGQVCAPGLYLVVYELNGRRVNAEWLARKWAP